MREKKRGREGKAGLSMGSVVGVIFSLEAIGEVLSGFEIWMRDEELKLGGKDRL